MTKERKYLLLDFRYIEAASKQVEGFEIVLFNNLEDSINNILKDCGVDTVYFELGGLSLKKAKYFKNILGKINVKCIFDDQLDNMIQNTRMIKSKYEVDKIRKAQKITEDSFGHVLNIIKPGITEKDIALEIEFFMKHNKAEDIAFDLIVVSGKNTSQPHGVPTYKKIEYGDFVTIDIGAVFDGYHSDMTRTICIGKTSDDQKKVYNTVLNAQVLGINSIRADIECLKVDKVVRDYIDNAGFKNCFGHSTGHGVGLEIHEYPYFSPSCDAILEEGMVLTVEPGIYLNDNFGVRIEDMILVEKDGFVNLTSTNKNLIEI